MASIKMRDISERATETCLRPVFKFIIDDFKESNSDKKEYTLPSEVIMALSGYGKHVLPKERRRMPSLHAPPPFLVLRQRFKLAVQA
jgi:hypothetical protein